MTSIREGIDARIAELREAIEEARSMPMSASVMINRAEVLDLVDRLERAVGESLTEANALLSDRDALLTAGQSEADEIVRLARAERDKLVSDTDVYRLAAERAEELRAESEREAAALRAEAEEYVESSLATFDLTLERTLATVRRGRSRLNGGFADGADIKLPEHFEG